ncbi:MAG: flavin reductase family protein, partial [Candidatus Krumholzibacteriia bacterium]
MTSIEIGSDAKQWRELYPLFVGFVNPRPIALVSSISGDGVHNLAPFSFYNMVSALPPVVVFAPANRRDGATKDTLRNIRETREFVIATVTEEIVRQAVDCAAEIAPEESEFEFSGLTPTPAMKVGPPLVRESPMNIECAVR